MWKWVVGIAVVVIIALIGGGIIAATRSDDAQVGAVDKPQLMSMEASGQAMQDSGAAIERHGQAMLDDGRRTGDQDLTAHGEHWIRDGQQMVQGGQWMTNNPTAPGSLVSSPVELREQGNWTELTKNAQAMIHDPSKARGVNIEALRWNGLAMRGEGQNMIDHAAIMAEEVELMVQRHGLQGQAAADLRRAVEVMRQAGGHLKQNGQAMIDYADRLRRSMGAR